MSGTTHALGYDAAPTFAAPMRFFLTAPLFGVAAGLLLLLVPDLLESRWTPGALALTHLITVGFMLTVMVGALFQILPVVAGAVLPSTNTLAAVVHLGLAAGAAALVWGLAMGSPDTLVAAVWLLGSALSLFFVAAMVALLRAPITQATPRDLRLALMSLGIAIVLGLTLAMILARGLALPLLEVLKLHVGWALLGGAGMLLAAASWIVVPMFQITPAYPALLTRYWALGACTLLVSWTGAVLAGIAWIEFALAIGMAGLAATFIGTTLVLQRRSRKSNPDNTFRAFQLGMASFTAGLACVLVAHHAEDPIWPVLAGVLILHGGFVSVMIGMLYKIVPFLAWLHLTQDGVKAPNMRKLQPDAPVRRQLIAHAIAFGLLLLAMLSASPLLARIAGIAVAIEFGLLAINMIGVLRAYRRARAK